MEAPARGGDAASSPCARPPLPVRGGDPPAHPLRQAAREDSGNPAAGPDRAGDARSWPPSGPGHPLPPSQARAKDAAAARAAGLRHADHDAPYAARLEQPCGIRRARVSVRRVVERPDGTRSGEFLVRGGKGESIRCFADMALPVPAGPPVTCNALTGDRAFDEEWALMTTAPPRRRCSARSCAPSWAPTASAGCIWPTAV